jgi:hypothetical protein
MTNTRRIARVLLGALIWSAASTVSLACPICFQMDDGPVARGVVVAVSVLMAVTVGVLAAFARFVVRVARSAVSDVEGRDLI